MDNPKKRLITAAVVGVMAMVMVQFLPHAKVPESCKQLREQAWQFATNDSGLSWVIASVPESVMNQALADRYGALSDADCSGILPQLMQDRQLQQHTAWAPQMHQAGEDAVAAISQCHGKRLRGELKTHADSAQCSNPTFIEAFRKSGYPYMDLVAQFATQRVDIEHRLDQDAISEAQKQEQYAALILDIAAQERARLLLKK